MSRSAMLKSSLPFVLSSICLVLAGCGSSAGTPGGSHEEIELKGAGASFPAPLYQRWFAEYAAKHPGAKVEYTSVGSGAGIKQFTDNLVDFGASDAAMTPDEIAKVKEGVQLLPMTAGSIVLCFNLKDTAGEPITRLKLSRAAYAGIFLGDIKMWNDPAIASVNPDVKLPEKPISVVYRSDSSGTTYVFTRHLAAISEKWKAGPGGDKTVNWPIGSGAPKNDGVAGAIKDNEGAIGYVEFGFADKNKIAMASLENKAGKYPEPNLKNAASALASIKEFPSDLIVWLPDPEGDDSYPIVTYTWILVRAKFPDAEKLKGLKHLLKHCLTEGQKVSGELGYIPLPESVTKTVIAAIDNIKAPASTTP